MMRITIENRREEALDAGYVSLAGQITAGFNDFRRILEPWGVKAFCDGPKVVGMLMQKENEIHVAVLPEVRGKWLSRRLLKEIFAPIYKQYGKVKTNLEGAKEQERKFVERIRYGFATLEFPPAAIVAAGMIGSALISSEASKKAASTQSQAAQQAGQLQAQQFQQTQANLAPYTAEGQIGLGQINAQLPQFNQPFTMQQFQQSPAYQFNLQQGQQAINKAAASRGMYYAPQTLQDISKFSQGLASNEFQNSFQNYQQDLANRWSRLMGLTNVGQTSAAGVGNLGAASAAQQGGFMTQGANAQAAGTVGMANAIQNLAGQGYNAYALNQILQQDQGSNFGGNYISPGDLSALQLQAQGNVNSGAII